MKNMVEKGEAEEREAIEEKMEEPDRTGRDFSPDKEKSHGEILAESRLWPGGIFSG